MYRANSPQELLKLMMVNKFPIVTSDSDTIKVIKTLDSLKKKGVTTTILEKFLTSRSDDALCIAVEVQIVLTIVTAATLIALVALWMGKNVKVIFKQDGSVVVETK
jgi:hypothetical protein